MKRESARAISISLSVGKTQIQTTAKEKDEIRCRWQGGKSAERKYGKIQKHVYPNLNEAV